MHFGSRPNRSLPLSFLLPFFRDAQLPNGLLLHLFSILHFSYDFHPPLSLSLLSVPTFTSWSSQPSLPVSSPFRTYLSLPPLLKSRSSVVLYITYPSKLRLCSSTSPLKHALALFSTVLLHTSMPFCGT